MLAWWFNFKKIYIFNQSQCSTIFCTRLDSRVATIQREFSASAYNACPHSTESSNLPQSPELNITSASSRLYMTWKTSLTFCWFLIKEFGWGGLGAGHICLIFVSARSITGLMMCSQVILFLIWWNTLHLKNTADTSMIVNAPRTPPNKKRLLRIMTSHSVNPPHWQKKASLLLFLLDNETPKT